MITFVDTKVNLPLYGGIYLYIKKGLFDPKTLVMNRIKGIFSWRGKEYDFSNGAIILTKEGAIIRGIINNTINSESFYNFTLMISYIMELLDIILHNEDIMNIRYILGNQIMKNAIQIYGFQEFLAAINSQPKLYNFIENNVDQQTLYNLEVLSKIQTPDDSFIYNLVQGILNNF